MCIRDSVEGKLAYSAQEVEIRDVDQTIEIFYPAGKSFLSTCLLYTSDAADERSSVDLGGRRIIKKKTKIKNGYSERSKYHVKNSQHTTDNA